MKLITCGIVVVVTFVTTLLQAANPTPFPDDPACTQADRIFMKRAYELARDAVKRGNAPFGAVFVVEGKIVAESENSVNTSKDPTKHAETALISKFGPKLDRNTFRLGTLYTSSEPCVMCTGAILNSGVLKVVYGTTESQFQLVIDPKEEKSSLNCRKIIAKTNPAVKVKGPLMEKEGLALHEAYWPEQMKKWKAQK
jgi:tRNA(Arg) A34 adenosine deaminase TadA